MYKIFDIDNSNTLLVRKYRLLFKKNYNINILMNTPLIGCHNYYSKSINLENVYNLNTNSNSNSYSSNNINNSNKSINTKKSNSFNKSIVK